MKMVISIVFCMFTRGYHQSSALHHAFLGTKIFNPSHRSGARELRAQELLSKSEELFVSPRHLLFWPEAGPKPDRKDPYPGGKFRPTTIGHLLSCGRTVDGFMSRRDATCHEARLGRHTMDGPHLR